MSRIKQFNTYDQQRKDRAKDTSWHLWLDLEYNSFELNTYKIHRVTTNHNNDFCE